MSEKSRRKNDLQAFLTRKPWFQQSKTTLVQRLIERENFWILKLETLYPKGFNMQQSK